MVDSIEDTLTAGYEESVWEVDKDKEPLKASARSRPSISHRWSWMLFPLNSCPIESGRAGTEIAPVICMCLCMHIHGDDQSDLPLRRSLQGPEEADEEKIFLRRHDQDQEKLGTRPGNGLEKRWTR